MEKSRKPDRVVVGADTRRRFSHPAPHLFAVRQPRSHPLHRNHARNRRGDQVRRQHAAADLHLVLERRRRAAWRNLRQRAHGRPQARRHVGRAHQHMGIVCLQRRGRFVLRQGHPIADLPVQERRTARRPAAIGLRHQRIPENLHDRPRRRAKAGANFNQKTVALLGLSFKQRTNDMRDSSSLKVVEALLGRGVGAIRAYDPLAMHEARALLQPGNQSPVWKDQLSRKRRRKRSAAAICSSFRPTGRNFAGCRAPLSRRSSRPTWSSTVAA